VAALSPVLVLWQDAWFDPDQCGENEWRDEYLVSTVGFIVRETDTVLSVAMERLPEEDGYRAVTHVPRGMIVEVRRLEHRAEPGGLHRPNLSQRSAVVDSNGDFAGYVDTFDVLGDDSDTVTNGPMASTKRMKRSADSVLPSDDEDQAASVYDKQPGGDVIGYVDNKRVEPLP
jgi:hypothetical protein